MFKNVYTSLWRPALVCLAGASSATTSTVLADLDEECGVHFQPDERLMNWSSTHSSNVRKLYEPCDDIEVKRLLEHHSVKKTKLRPVGTALSPNGLGMPNDDSDGISLRNINQIRVNSTAGTVTVGAGATVADVLKELSKHDLTLENFSSIQEQQLGGWTQVAAHGTGISLATVEEQIIEMKMVTPAHGVITMSNFKNSDLFRMAKVGLGSLGIVTELTLKCIPRMKLKEVTEVFDRKSIVSRDSLNDHYNRLISNRHVRYMWLPYTDTVVSVTSKIDDSSKYSFGGLYFSNGTVSPQPNNKMVELLRECLEKYQGNGVHSISKGEDLKVIKNFSVAHLRDLLLEFGPLSVQHIRAINQAESEYWKGSQSSRVEDSINILGFDCGGEQWVLEVCIPLGHLHNTNNKDINFVRELLSVIEKEQIPAASPIEQRWTARSTASMSPAFSSDPDDKFCWVGVIMYIPSNQNEAEREDIRKAFVRYCNAIDPILEKYKAQIHWAKIELPDKRDTSEEEFESSLSSMRKRLARKYPVRDYCDLKNVLDPEGILSNKIIDNIFDCKE